MVSPAPPERGRQRAETEPAAESTRRSTRRWYAHGWNRPLSWELILRVTPRLPRFLLRPLHHVTTLVCFTLMPRERAAARRNLRRVTGTTGMPNLRLAYRLFYNFSRFMVAYAEMREFDLARCRGRMSGVEEVEASLQQVIDEGKGAIIMTMHIGQWDLGLKMMSRYDVPVHVVMLSEDPAEVTRYADEARAMPNLKVHQTGGSPLLAVELMAALKRGEFVAIQADRPAGGNVMTVDLFGAPTRLPAGWAQLAMATGAPVLPIFVLFDRGDRYRVLTLPPFRFNGSGREQRRGGASEDALREPMRRLAAMMETVVASYPDQWFNFYDVWDPDA